MSYPYPLDSNEDSIRKKTVLVIGSGKMGKAFAEGLSYLGVKDVTIIGHSEENVSNLCRKFGYKPLHGGYEKHLSTLEKKDLVIICTPIMKLLPAATMAIESNQANILIEKPASIDPDELYSFNEKLSNQNVRIAYNRLMYPSLKKLHELIIKDGGATSCHFSFSELLDRINFSNNPSIVYDRWGICNSLHVISVVFDLLGLPNSMSALQTGKLPWHESGSVFVGSGITEKNIPFSYNSSWEVDGRWFIEVTTKKNHYRLMPLEELYYKNSSQEWKNIPVSMKYGNTKLGICEEILAMFNKNNTNLPTLKEGIKLIQIAAKIFGY